MEIYSLKLFVLPFCKTNLELHFRNKSSRQPPEPHLTLQKSPGQQVQHEELILVPGSATTGPYLAVQAQISWLEVHFHEMYYPQR